MSISRTASLALAAIVATSLFAGGSFAAPSRALDADPGSSAVEETAPAGANSEGGDDPAPETAGEPDLTEADPVGPTDDTGTPEEAPEDPATDVPVPPILHSMNGAIPGIVSESRSGSWLWPGVVYTGIFADPFVLPVKEAGRTVYYAYSTNSGNRNLPVLKSTDLKTWNVTSYSSDMGWADRRWDASYDPFEDDAIPMEIRGFNYLVPNSTPFEQRREAWLNADGLVSPRPSWAKKVARNWADPGDFGWREQENWAPAVGYFNGRYHAYMAIRAGANGEKFCIGLATATAPAGPYRYVGGNSNVVCPADRPNGVIDPEPFQYGGRWYLLWKSESATGTLQGLHAQEIDPASGRLKAGSRIVNLLQRDLAPGSWEAGVIENPSMATIGGTTYLFYSGGEYWSKENTTSNYATGYAICPRGPTGACHRPKGDNRLLASAGAVQGPGGGSAFQDAKGNWKFAYHSYTLGGQWDLRRLRVANIYRWPSSAVAIADGGKPKFADVPAHQQFHSHIMWLAGKGITTGDRNGNFRPLDRTSRSDMAAFLYRYSGSPKYTPKGASPFADVTPSTRFYKEIRWMYDRGLATGAKDPRGGKPRFMPNASMSREAMAAFFYRLSGVKGYAPKGKEPLADVGRSSKFYREIRWMYDSGITTGINRGGSRPVFDERGTTRRDAFAAFLKRYDAKFG